MKHRCDSILHEDRSPKTDSKQKVFVLGAGAVGLALAAYLTREGRNVTAVRTTRNDVSLGKVVITVREASDQVMEVAVETVSLAQLTSLDGIVVVTTKSYANSMIADALKQRAVTGPIVIMQNGVGVERPFLKLPDARIYRCILYMTAQTSSGNEVTFRSITPSPIGVVKGLDSDLEECVRALTTQGFPFHAEPNIQRDIWKKSIMNSVFNSICPLLDLDNGIFARDEAVVALAREVVTECAALAAASGVSFTTPELMEQVFKISSGSQGVLISTLQDIRHGRETEIESLNLEMARMAASMNPPINLCKTELLGRMVLAKSRLGRVS